MLPLDALLYGRLYLPNSTLEALYLRRLSPRSQLKISGVSDPRLPNGGSILALLQHDAARYSTEYIYSTDSSLLGVRGLYNFGPAPGFPSYRTSPFAPATLANPTSLLPISQPRPHGLFSAGAELYYSPVNKSSGMSCGLRFATLPAHAGFPYTMTLTINPLMGNLSSTYTVVASEMLTLSSCFDFNFYSYESELKLGLELWRRQRSPPVRHRDLNHTNKDSNKPNTREESPHPQQTPLSPPPPLLPPFPQNPQNKQQDLNKTTSEKNEEEEEEEENISGVLKAKIDQRGAIALLWEGRVKDLLYGCGVVLDARRGEGMTRSVGLEISYSS